MQLNKIFYRISQQIKTKVCIVGAGPCCLATLRAFDILQKKGQKIPQITVYEKQDNLGGQWNYTWQTGTDNYGDTVHSSMYNNLWSNGPKEVLEMSDYTFEEHFGQAIPSYPPRPVLADYILGRAKKIDPMRYIKLNMCVQNVKFVSGQYQVDVWDKVKNDNFSNFFDHVIIATGPFSVPNHPKYEGFNDFQGRIIHAHDFKDANQFKGQNLLLIGSSYSAEDITLQCYKFGAKQITIAYRSNPMGYNFPSSITEKKGLQKVTKNSAIFEDGTETPIDSIISCTGYLHSFNFIEPKLRLTASNKVQIHNLWKGVYWIQDEHPYNHLFYIGMQDYYYTFNMFDLQAWITRDIIMKKTNLPTKFEMLRNVDEQFTKFDKCKNDIEKTQFETDNILDLQSMTDYPIFDAVKMRDQVLSWKKDKENNIMTYRDQTFDSAITGNKSPVHHTTWLKEFDDSITNFLKSKL